MSEIGARRFILFALGVLLVTTIGRLPSLLHPLPIDDEVVYSIVANEIVDGGLPYVDAVERKPPLLFWTYAAVFKLAGKFNWPALHAFALLWIVATIISIYAIGATVFNRAAGLTAALLYAIFTPWGDFRNLAFNGELLMNFPIALAFAITFRPSLMRFRPELLLAGALLCAAFLLKQPAAAAAVPLGIYLLLPAYRGGRQLLWRDSLIHAGLLTCGFFATLGFFAALLQHQGILADAIYWTIRDHTIPHVFWTHGALFTLAFTACCLPLLIGTATFFRQPQSDWSAGSAERTTLVGLLLASIIGCVAGGRFYPHYYIQLILPLAILAAPFYAALWSNPNLSSPRILSSMVSKLWLGSTVVVFLILNVFGLADRRNLSQSGEYLLHHSAENDRIFVWGQRSRIYLDARRRPACRYITTFPLTGYIFGGHVEGANTRNRILPGAWDNLKKDFGKHPPVYIIDTQFRDHDDYPIRNFPILAHLLSSQYRQVKTTNDAVIYRTD